MLNDLPARFSAIRQLQAIRTNHLPGSPRYEEVEHAIDLALNERRAVDPYLVRNVLRDARRIIDRKRKAWPHVQFVDEIPRSNDDGPLSQDAVAVMDFTTPEALVTAGQFADAIVAEVASSSQHAARVMEGLLADEPIAITAKASGISEARVNQLRRKLRGAASQHLGVSHV